MASKYEDPSQWGPWSRENYAAIAQGIDNSLKASDPWSQGGTWDAYNNQPAVPEQQRERARQILAQMDKAGVNYSFQLQGLDKPDIGSGTFGDLVGDLVTSPAFLVAAGGVGAMYAAPAAAAGAGSAAGGSGAAAGTVAGASGELAAGGAAAYGGGAAGGAAAGSSAAGAGSAGTGAATMPAAVAPSSAGYTASPFVSASGAPATTYTLSNTAAAAGGAGAAGTAMASGGGGTTTGTTSGTTATTEAAKQTALGNILNGSGTAADYLTVFGQIAPSLLGMYASDKQADALGAQAARYEAMGAPYRDRLGALYSDPTAFLKSPEVQVPVQQGTDALARALSTQGNPMGSGHALQELQNYSANQLFGRLGAEKDRLAGFGGLTSYQAQAPQIGMAAIGAQGNVYNALGHGIGAVTNPPRSLEDMLKAYNISQGLQ